MKYMIELTEEQMRVMENCTNLYMRLSMGQTWDLADMLCEGMLDHYDRNGPDSKIIFERYITKRNAIREILGSATKIAFGAYGTPPAKTKDGMICECIWDAIRVVRGKSIYGQVLPIGDEPVPKIEKMEMETDGEFL